MAQPGQDDRDVFAFANEGIRAGIERTNLVAAISEPVRSKQGSPRKAASSRMRRMTVAPSIPGSIPSTITALAQIGGGRKPSPPLAAMSTR